MGLVLKLLKIRDACSPGMKEYPRRHLLMSEIMIAFDGSMPLGARRLTYYADKMNIRPQLDLDALTAVRNEVADLFQQAQLA